MVDLIQINSFYNLLNFKKDEEYISSLLDITVYEINYKVKPEDRFDFEKEVKEIKKFEHIHLDMTAINRITQEKVDIWNSKTSYIKRLISQYENDINLVNKKYVDDKFKKINTSSIYINSTNIIINGLDGSKWTVSVDDRGVLTTSKITI